MFSKMYANPKMAAAFVGVVVGLIGAGIFSLAGWLDGETPSVGFVVVACLIGFLSEGGVATAVAYWIFFRIGAGIAAREKHLSKT